MNAWKSRGRTVRRATCQSTLWLAVLAVQGLCLQGCGDGLQPSPAAQLTRFENAGPSGPAVDLDSIVEARLDPGAYRVVPGDVLQLDIPRVLDPQMLQAMTPTEGKEALVCRVDDLGTIVLPVIGRLAVMGKTLAEIEASIRAEYYPRYVKTPPPVYVSVLEYKTRRVSIVGAVTRPGIYSLRHDQTSLVGLLMEAGGIVEQGAAVIRITTLDPAGAPAPRMRPAVPSETEGLWKAPRQASPAMFAQAASANRASRRDGAIAVRALFQPEGPLNTTGWLAFTRGDEVLARRWLDLGSEFQTSTFVGAVARASADIRTADLQASLWRLAQHLESSAAGHSATLAAEKTGWTTTSDGRFLASLSGRLTDPFGATTGPRTTVTDATGKPVTKTLALPVRGLNIPFADVALHAGDSVVVEAPQEQYVSVMGLVSRPGNFPYPPNTRYTLVQALALAGGLDLTADPRYVCVYRLNADGAVASATFHLSDPKRPQQLTDALAVPLKPGDVVSVEHTPRTRTNVFFDRIFRISLGLYFSPDNLWD